MVRDANTNANAVVCATGELNMGVGRYDKSQELKIMSNSVNKHSSVNTC